MILGRGSSRGDKAIIKEYMRFLDNFTNIATSEVRNYVRAAPETMRQRIGKRITDWTHKDILTIVSDRKRSTSYYYRAFIAFLLFRGYLRADVEMLASLHVRLSRMHCRAFLPYKQRLKMAEKELGYVANEKVGSVLNLLIYLLAVVHKPLEELTRADFDSFRSTYTDWYRKQRRRDGGSNARLTRLEYYLVHWKILPPAGARFQHEEYFSQLRHPLIHQAVMAYMRWCDIKYEPSTIHSCRAAILKFFLWLQTYYPQAGRLDEVTRPAALAYAEFLNSQVDDGTYTCKYRIDLYRRVRLFFKFALSERLEGSPERNPFARKDMPTEPDPVPRYMTDQQIRAILTYCAQEEASVLERVVTITLLHTGIRASELLALKATDIVKIQGRWKLHVRLGKGNKDRVIPLTDRCLKVLNEWQQHGWEKVNDNLFTCHGRVMRTPHLARRALQTIADKLGLVNITPHRFRHTFAVALLNYGMKESVLQKLMGHSTLDMTLQYARIIDQTVERDFADAVQQMQDGPLRWVPSFFAIDEYTLFAEGDAVNWIRLPHGYCRRNQKLHCESDVKCLLCDRFIASPSDLPRLLEMHDRFIKLGLHIKADVVASKMRLLESQTVDEMIPPQIDVASLR